MSYFPRALLNAMKQGLQAQRAFRPQFVLVLERCDSSMGHMKMLCLLQLPSSPFLNKQVSCCIVTDANLENLPMPVISTFKLHFNDRGAEVASHGEQSCVLH